VRARLPVQRACAGGDGGAEAPLPAAWEVRVGRATGQSRAAAAALEAPSAAEAARWGTDAGSVLAVLAIDVEAPCGGGAACTWSVAAVAAELEPARRA